MPVAIMKKVCCCGKGGVQACPALCEDCVATDILFSGWSFRHGNPQFENIWTVNASIVLVHNAPGCNWFFDVERSTCTATLNGDPTECVVIAGTGVNCVGQDWGAHLGALLPSLAAAVNINFELPNTTNCPPGGLYAFLSAGYPPVVPPAFIETIEPGICAVAV